MKIYDFIKSKRVTLKELEDIFTPVGRKPNGTTGKCEYCGDTINNRTIASEPWTVMEHCCKCSSITVRFPPDLMSGCTDENQVIVFRSTL